MNCDSSVIVADIFNLENNQVRSKNTSDLLILVAGRYQDLAF